MATLHELYQIREQNLSARREFIGLRSSDVAALKRLRSWASERRHRYRLGLTAAGAVTAAERAGAEIWGR